MSGVGSALASLGRSAHGIAVALRDELAELGLAQDRNHQCAMTSIAVVLATAVAMAARVDAVWWAAISAFVSTQPSAPASIRRGALRITGTAAGAGLALLLSPWLAEDLVALSLVLLVVSTVGSLGMLVSSYGYAWLVIAVTVNMVLLSAPSDPVSALETACNRTAEVSIGTVSAILVSILLAKPAPAAPVVAPGWSDLLGAQYPALQHALRAGIGVMMVPLVWNWLALPSLSSAAVTVSAVMAIPSVSNDTTKAQQQIVERSMHRLIGCLAGGCVALVCLALSIDALLPWLLMLTTGVWIAAHVQNSQRGIGYIGMQAAMAFILTLVEGDGPPDSILPAVNRLAGVTGGLLILLIVSVLTAPSAVPSAAEGAGATPPPA